MGRRSISGGVSAHGNRIQFDFVYPRKSGKRYRPTIDSPPTEANLRNARVRMEGIKQRIRNGMFVFEEEFPEYRLSSRVPTPTQWQSQPFDRVADAYLNSVRGELARATLFSYEKILKHHWRPKFGTVDFMSITASELKTFIGSPMWTSIKTRNNVLSAGKRVFEYGYLDYPSRKNPAERLKTLRIQKPRPTPFTLDEAETIIAGIRVDWGDQDADYVEFQFFAGARPSETIAVTWAGYDPANCTLSITGARVMGHQKSTTKNMVERDIELNPRALAVLERQRSHSYPRNNGIGPIFLRADGEPWHDVQTQWKHWQYTLNRLGIPYREPYQARHSSVTWNLMAGANLNWVAANHGHSVQVMLETYAKWMKRTSPQEIARLREVLGVPGNGWLPPGRFLMPAS